MNDGTANPPNTIRVLVCRVGAAPVIEEVPDDYDSLSALVGGMLQCAPLANGVDLWCNEEGMLLDLPFNRAVPAVALDIDPEEWNVIVLPDGAALPGTQGYHHVLGNFFLSRAGADGLASLTDDDVAEWSFNLA